MFSRIVFVFLVALLAIPVIPLTRPDDMNPPPWGAVAGAAKGKSHHGHKHKKHPKQILTPPPSTVTRTVRQSVTQTFRNTGRIAIPDDSNMNRTTKGKAAPYPSSIDVSGFTNGVVTDVNLTLTDWTHTSPVDVDFLLSKNDRQALVMSDVLALGPATDIDLTLDDEAETPVQILTSGTFRPSNFDHFDDTFDAPAPALNGAVDLSTFDGTDPNGTWQLWVMDNATDDVGALGDGWALEITAEVDVQVQEPASGLATGQDKTHIKLHGRRHGAGRRDG